MNNNDNILSGVVAFILSYINIIRYGFNFMFTFGVYKTERRFFYQKARTFLSFMYEGVLGSIA